MRILSVRRGFLADHSSTSYEFMAIDRPLDAKAKAAVSKLSRRVRPTSRRVGFIYHAEGYDIPGGWEPLMGRYYDVMYSESYDWWTLAVAFNTKDKALLARLRKYAFVGGDDLGVSVSQRAGRVIVAISCRLEAEALTDGVWDDEPEDEKNEDGGSVIVTDDSLLGLLARVRARLMKGDCQPLYAVWEVYGRTDDEEEEEEEEEPAPPKPRKTRAGAAVAAELAGLLATA